MKKLFYFLSIFMLNVFIPAKLIHSDFKAYQTAQNQWQQQISKNGSSQNQSETVQATSNNCPACSSSITSKSIIPPLKISIQDSSGNILFVSSLIPNSNFTVDNAILTVNIFPPSNPSLSSDASFYVMTTLKTIHGSILQKQINPMPSFQGSVNPLTFDSLPASISIYSSLPVATNSQGSNATQSGMVKLVTSTFLPSDMNKYSLLQNQQLFNLLCPISQEFLIQQQPGNMQITNTSGTLQCANNNTIISLPTSAPTTGEGIAPLAFSISDGSTISTLQFTGIHFNSSDLAQGLYATIHIFPPSTNNDQGGYFLVATIKTVDGLKLRKQTLSNVQFNAIPSSVLVTSGVKNSNPVLSYNFLDINLASQSIFNTQSPVILKMLILQASPGKTTALIL
ncbi:MAG: hypothetical protein NTU89_00055 [Candidatus Dependentiae bacterium]|nr:hypothetical protein [Candidatus Dependentiae bacterium]